MEDKVASAGRLNIVKALSLYDDLVVLEGRERMLKGRIVEPLRLNICGRERNIAELKQVVLDYAPTQNRSVRITQFNALGHLFYEYCDDRPTEVFRIETRDGRVESIAPERIAEIVPAELHED